MSLSRRANEIDSNESKDGCLAVGRYSLIDSFDSISLTQPKSTKFVVGDDDPVTHQLLAITIDD